MIAFLIGSAVFFKAMVHAMTSRTSRQKSTQGHKGFTLLFAVLVSSVLLAIGFGIFNIVYRELQLSSLTRDSDMAIFAADAGIECGLYWEFKGAPIVMFDPSDPEEQLVNCGGFNGIPAQVVSSGGNIATWSFTFPVGTATGDPSCAEVFITKNWNDFTTSIESNGRNEGGLDCSVGDRTVERTLRVDF